MPHKLASLINWRAFVKAVCCWWHSNIIATMFCRSTVLALLLGFGSSAAKPTSWDATQLDEDEQFWGRFLGIDGSMSMSIPHDDDDGTVDCVNDFDTLESLVNDSKDSTEVVSIRLCKDARIMFPKSIDLTNANFVMLCENNSCRLDGQGKTSFFKAGTFDGPFSAHNVAFDTIHFFNGKTTSSGGALQMFGGTTRFEECAFVNNMASDGGAMRIQDGQVTILGCLFQYNSAEDVGGAMKVEESVAGILDMTIRDTTFTDNVADTEGDDIYQDYAERASIDCGGEGSGNQFCDASTSSTVVSTNWPTSVCAGASTKECPVVEHNWNVIELS